jgi:uncharacterized protein
VDGRQASNIMDVRSCGGADCDSDHHLVQIKYQQRISKYKDIHGTRQRKYDIRKLNDMDIIKQYKQEIRKGITESNEQQNNQNEKRSETKWENIKQAVTTVAMKWLDMRKGRRGMIGMMKSVK